MTRLDAYTSYRESDVPWVGRIPRHWETRPLHAVMRESKTSNRGMIERNLLSLSFGRIIRRSMTDAHGLLPGSFETYQIVEPGDIVFRFTDLQNDKRSLRTAPVEERGIVTSAYVCASPTDLDSRFAAYLMRSYDTSKVFYGLGGGVRQSLKFDDVRRLPVLTPPSRDQRAIADYLDRETVQSDALIGKQEQLIRMLRERQTAVFEHEFSGTQGKRLTSVRRVLRSVNRPAVSGLGVITAYRDGVVTLRSKRRSDGYTFSDSENGYQEIRPGDFVFHALDGFAGAVGVSDSRGVATPAYHVCETIGDDDLRYVAMYVRYLGLSGFLSTQAPNVRQRSVDFRNWGTFARVPLALPDYEQQRVAVQRIEEQTAKIDTLTNEAKRFIELSKERQAALITAAVTGQIDVREAV